MTAAELRAANADLLAKATAVDSAIAREEKATPLDVAMAGDLAQPAGAPPPGDLAQPAGDLAQPADAIPALKQSCVVLLQMTTARLHSEWGWSDPGDEWREAVGNNLAILADRYIGEFAATNTVEVSLALMVLPWVIENVIVKGFPAKKKTPAPAGNNVESFPAPTLAGSARGDGVREVDVS